MKWRIEYTPRSAKALRRLDRVVAERVFNAVERLRDLDDPTTPCKALTGPLAGLWRLRVGDYRVILDVQRDQLVIVALDLGHRSSVYDD